MYSTVGGMDLGGKPPAVVAFFVGGEGEPRKMKATSREGRKPKKRRTAPEGTNFFWPFLKCKI